MLKFKAEMTLQHMTIRPEKAGQDVGDAASDLKLSGTVKAEQCRALFSTDESFEQIVGSKFNDANELVTTDLGEFELNRVGIGVKVSIKSAHGIVVKFEEKAEFNKIKLKLVAGREVEMKCRLQVYPSDADLGPLRAMLGQGVTVSVRGKGQTPAEDAAADAEEAGQGKLPGISTEQPSGDGDEGEGDEQPEAGGRVRGARQQPKGATH